MYRRILLALTCASVFAICQSSARVEAQQPGQWGSGYTYQNWNRFYHYPYVYYPQNFRSNDYYRSAQDMYYRYPQEMRVPVYNKQWQNYYPVGRKFHYGHHFMLDVF